MRVIQQLQTAETHPNHENLIAMYGGVTQLIRVSVCRTGSRGFESRHPRLVRVAKRLRHRSATPTIVG